jgi:quercetin dioxygenase-like cupin family protein
MFVHWLADRDHGDTKTTVFNVTQFPPNRSHEIHRHVNAEEYFFVLEGSGLHLTRYEPVRLHKGDLVFLPQGEWHGFANDTEEPTLAVTVMGGVAHYSDAGYETLPGPNPSVIAALKDSAA